MDIWWQRPSFLFFSVSTRTVFSNNATKFNQGPCSKLRYYLCYAQITKNLQSIPTFVVSKKSWLFLSWRWEGNALLWAARWNNRSPWQPCNRWIKNVIQMLFIWNKQSIADVAKWTFLAKTKRFIFKIKSSVGNSFDLHRLSSHAGCIF